MKNVKPLHNMKIRKYNRRFAFMDDLIRRKATGTPAILGWKSGLSKRQVKRIIQGLKELQFTGKSVEAGERLGALY